MGSEEYSFTWNEHDRNVVGVFGRYLEEEALVDCTIAAEGKHLKAHKLMLSACCPYFEVLFRQEMKEEKVLDLEDIRFEDLKSLIEFMYRGQVIVPKERLQDFVRAAESLQIKGLPSDFVHNLQREATPMSVVQGRGNSASHQTHKSMRSSAVGGEIREPQRENLKTSSIGNKQSGDERPLTHLQTDLSEENVCPQPQFVLESDSNREKTVIPADKDSLVEPKEEMDIEDTPIWDSEGEDNNTVTDLFSSAIAGEENQKELTSVSGSVSSSYGNATSPLILKNKSERSLPSCSSVTASIPSSANTAESTEQIVSVKIEPIVRIEVLPAVVSSDNESTVEPMHQVWVKEMRTWEGEEKTIGTHCAVVCNQETTNKDQDVAASNLYYPAVRPNLTFVASTSSSIVAEGEREDVKVEEPQMSNPCVGPECKRIEISDCSVDNMLKSKQHGFAEIDGNKVEKVELVVGSVENSSEVETGTKRNEAVEEEEEDAALQSEPVSELLGKEWHKYSGCLVTFDTVNNLQVHVKKQQKEKCSNRCEVCDATFARRCDLTNHIRIHTGERPFECDLCKMSFSRLYSLTVHKRTHNSKRPYECDVCKMSFSRTSHLTEHKRTHTGERPFECNLCKRSFSQKGNLFKHKRTHRYR